VKWDGETRRGLMSVDGVWREDGDIPWGIFSMTNLWLRLKV